MQDNFSIRDWKNTKLYKEEFEGTKHIVKYSSTNDTFQVWKGDEIVTDFATKERAEAEAKKLNNLDSIKRVDSMQEVEDFEANAEDIEFEIPGDENAKPVVDKELNKSLSKQDKIIKQWQDINAQMQRNLKNFKEAGDENAKDMAKMALKDLTPAYRAAKDAYEKLKGVKL